MERWAERCLIKTKSEKWKGEGQSSLVAHDLKQIEIVKTIPNLWILTPSPTQSIRLVGI